MKKNMYYISFLLVILLTLRSSAKDTSRLSLNDIIVRIDTAYPEILMYDSKIKSIQALSDGAKSWMPPTFSVGADRFPYDFTLLDSKDDPMNQAGWMFSIEQMVPLSGKLKAKQNYINSLSKVQQNSSDWTKNQLRSNARLLYYQRLIAERKVKVIQENIQVLNLFIQTAEERYKYNQADLSTVYKAQAKITDLKNMEAMLQSQIAESNIGMNTFMNRDINTVFSIDTSYTIENYTSQLSADTTLFNRSDILSMENSISAMTLNRKYMASFKKPDFGFKFQHMQMYGMPNQFSVMGMITIPILPWSSRMYKSEVKSMGYEINAMQKQKETMQLMAQRMSAEKLTMMQYEKKQLQNYENEIIPSYQKILETSLLAYKQNNGSFFILLDAWEMTLMKQLDYLDKLNSVLKLQVEYEYETERK